MRVVSIFIGTFKLILVFDNGEYRLLDIKQFLQDDKGKLAEVRDNIDMFQTAMLDTVAGTVVWENGIDFEPEHLYSESVEIDHIFGDEEIKRG